MHLVAWFDEISENNLAYFVGGKGASLCCMYRNKFPVPPGFIICTAAFDYFIKESGLQEHILKLVSQIDWDNNSSLADVASQIRTDIENTPMPTNIVELIKKYYASLGNNVSVAVRSSGTAEDLENASFAGQQDTYLFIVGIDNVINSIKQCWASLYNGRALFYRHQKGFSESNISIAVVVQQMINADKAGVMFTANPITKRKDEVVIEAVWGLGEGLVQGIITPDNYCVKKDTYEIVNERISEKEIMIIGIPEEGKVKEVPVPEARAAEPVLSKNELKELVDIAVRIEKLYNKPQDVEWAFENGLLYLLQARAITTLD
ncbi:PEP/pyruvate-binding domain-containing protein [Tepidanaerobacter syntrophicus]|uniref:PEP/pyruvate-binding domain-containing protein n=1 Tax=Tepidanaerobacter syntrophicus TaxID=224999 RepID=UPI001BD3719A|nr:PEP/pyruvate-binding domain-containing protein [Tepidanaerobacter syntrophicus]